MAKTDNKIREIPLDKINVVRTANVREDAAYAVESLEPLIADLASRGQQEAAVVEKIGDTYVPVKGFRRSEALRQAAERGIIDPLTVKRDGDGKMVEGTGKPFSVLRAIVYENLTERERLDLLLDHGQRRNLNKVELQISFERAFSAGYSEKEIVTILFSLLEIHYPPTRQVEDSADARLAYYRGVVQTAKEAWRSPTVLHEAWTLRLAGKQAWPTKAEMVELSKLYQKEAEGNNAINKGNPGPKFTERWEALKKKQADAAADGKTRAKSDAMMNRAQVEEAKKATDSLILKLYNDVITRRISQDKLVLLDKIVVAIEQNMSEEARKALLSLQEVQSN